MWPERMKFSFQHRAFYCYVIMTLWILFIVTAMYKYMGLRTEEGGARRAPSRHSRADARLRRIRSLHCHPPEEIVRGTEGAPGEESWQLRGVVAVTRHGDRGPLTHLRGGDTLPCNAVPASAALRSYSEYVWNASAGGRASWVQAPGPFHNFPTLPVTSAATSCALGQLTLLGVQQMLATGEILKEAYAERLGWTDSTEADYIKQAAGEVTSYSTRYRRTFQSALALLFALPPLAAFPARAAALRESHTLSFCFRECACARAGRLQQRLSVEGRSRLAAHPAISELVERVSRVVLEARERPDAEVLRDALLAAVCHRAPLPCADVRTRMHGDGRAGRVARSLLGERDVADGGSGNNVGELVVENDFKVDNQGDSVERKFANLVKNSLDVDVGNDTEGIHKHSIENNDLDFGRKRLDADQSIVTEDSYNISTERKFQNLVKNIQKKSTRDVKKNPMPRNFQYIMNQNMKDINKELFVKSSYPYINRRKPGGKYNNNIVLEDIYTKETFNKRNKSVHNENIENGNLDDKHEVKKSSENSLNSLMMNRVLLNTDIETLNLELDYINNQLDFNNEIGRKARDIIEKNEKVKPPLDFDAQMEKEKLSYYRQKYLDHVDPNYEDVVVVRKHLDSDFNFNMEKENGNEFDEENYSEVTPQDNPTQECVRKEQLTSLFAFVDWNQKQNAKSTTNKKKSILNAYGFIHNIVKNMIRMISENKPKLVYYSGHDKTIQALISALGLTELHHFNVYYASRMIFEVYRRADEPRAKRKAIAQDFYFRAVLNGADVTNQLSFCRGWHNVVVGTRTAEGDGRAYLCPIENIVRFIHDDYFAMFNASNFKDACATH